LFGTTCGFVVGISAIALWIATFSPHGGVELSAFLFPISRVVLQAFFPNQSIPVLLWYVGALLQWILLGAFVDLVRTWIRARRRARR
jgi:hypothetical protein